MLRPGGRDDMFGAGDGRESFGGGGREAFSAGGQEYGGQGQVDMLGIGGGP